MAIDPENRVVKLCAAGVAVEGDSNLARELFTRAWELCTDDWERSIAAHYLARHQPNAQETLRWNQRALEHAQAAPNGAAEEFLPSLYLNLAESYRHLGRYDEALDCARRARGVLASLAEGGYRDLVSFGIERIEAQIGGKTSE